MTAHAPGWRNGDALVAFGGPRPVWWLRWLKPGFHHCMVCIRAQETWVLCDPLLHRTEVSVYPGHGTATLLQWLHDNAYRVVPVRRRNAPRRLAPIRPYTCVEAVKRHLGIRTWWIVTPWQLFRYLLGSRG